MATFTMDRVEGSPGTHLVLTADGPARFELQVGEDGSVVLFGYSGTEDNEDQDPNVVFDTDGSFAVFTDDEA